MEISFMPCRSGERGGPYGAFEISSMRTLPAVPELPEVERARALIADRALRRVIADVDDTDTYVCRPHGPGELQAALVGRQLITANRIGKSMWCETGRDGPDLGLHLGMAGRIVVDDASDGDPANYENAKPIWDRFTIFFEDGGRLILRDKRRLGRAVLEPDISGLGPDAAGITRREFRERVGRGTAPVKARLMDQSVLAGVGNLLADELLWRARISPLRPANELSESELDELRRTTRSSIRDAVKLGGVHTGKLMAERKARGHCPRCGTELRVAQVGGRTTVWCPKEQA
jgi:formamidopyrimidine-DNA glycosylase